MADTIIAAPPARVAAPLRPVYIVAAAAALAAMTAAILRLAANHAERAQFAANAEEAFHAHFTLQAMADAYMDLYQNSPRILRAAKR